MNNSKEEQSKNKIPVCLNNEITLEDIYSVIKDLRQIGTILLFMIICFIVVVGLK